MIRTIIIDDEPSATNLLALMLETSFKGELEITAITNDPFKGKTLIDKHDPDLVFLDIEMPVLSGIELLRGFNDPHFKVIITTAYDKYAIDALKLSAVDYLLKPLDQEEVLQAVKKVKNQLSSSDAVEMQFSKLRNFINRMDKRIGVSMADRVVFLHPPEIVYCEANGPYTEIHLINGKKLVTSKTLKEFEEKLDDENFFRIHHSTLINLKRVKEFQRNDGGYVVMENNEKLEVSQRRRKEFLTAIINGSF